MAIRTSAWRAASSLWTNPALPTRPQGPIRLTVVQYGDHAEAARWCLDGGDETYYAQRYTVDVMARLAASPGIESLTVLSFGADAPQAVTQAGVRTIGVGLYPPGRPARVAAVLAAVAKTRPTHLVVASPIPRLIRWGLRRRLAILPLFADSFRSQGFRGYLRNRLLARLLNDPAIEVVSNHNLAASLDLARIGVDPAKIVPFDWPQLISARDHAPKPAPAADRAFRLLYVGQMLEAKGVGDAVRALAILRRRGRDATLTLIGGGDGAAFETLARREGVAEHLALLGRRPHREVLAEMRAHDAVLTPSHHAYPEGLPMTIYEALCMRVPVIASDHPMFALRIRDGIEALLHPERDAGALADRIERLASDGALYEELSIRAETSVEGYLCPLKWDQLLDAFLNPESTHQVKDYSLAKYPYMSRATAAPEA